MQIDRCSFPEYTIKKFKNLNFQENAIAAECVQLHGGWGYMMETPIARSYIDARVQTIYGGSNEIMKELIARPIVKPQ